ncbi:MAG: response regulator [Fibrobacteres bacterium]|nr:response regulator [Fibrobacterota bacterium]
MRQSVVSNDPIKNSGTSDSVARPAFSAALPHSPWNAASLVALVLATILAGLFVRFFNVRRVELSPYLTIFNVSDSVDGGHSLAYAQLRGKAYRFSYALQPGFAFPYAGGGLRLTNFAPNHLRDFSSFERIRFRARQEHSKGAPPVRLFIQSTRLHHDTLLLAPNEIQFRPTANWSEQTLDWNLLRLPSWFIAANSMEPAEQNVRLENVRELHFVSPDIPSLSDTGVLEISDVSLEGPRIAPLKLLFALQGGWIAWGIFQLVLVFRAWRSRAMSASSRARNAEDASLAKSEFLATMSHEIRTPLNGVLVPAQLLQQSELDAEQADLVETILESGNHLAAVLQDILDHSKIESGKIELERLPMDLRRTLGSVRRVFEPRSREKKLKLDFWVDPALPSIVVGDALRLRQIVMNLVSNAIKFTERGEIQVQVFASNLGGNRIRFEVSDTGIGIDAASINRLFRRFSQAESSTTRRFGGTGLGLSIAQGLVESMGGRIEVASTPNVGTKFRFEIELPPSQTAPRPGESTLEAMPLPVGARVLVVDDDRTNRKVAFSMLEKIGCVPSVAENGVEALDLLEQEAFRLVLMDLHMPRMDGCAVVRRVRGWHDAADPRKRFSSRTPIVALTADAAEGVRAMCLEAGMNDILTKPFRREDLLRMIDLWAQGIAPEPL